VYARRGFRKAKALKSAVSRITNTIGHQLVKKSDRRNTPLANPETMAIKMLMFLW
jgi:hypothetical protein